MPIPSNALKAAQTPSKPGQPFLSTYAKLMVLLTREAHHFPANLTVTSKDVALDYYVRQLEILVKEKPANITQAIETIQRNLAQFEANRRLQSAMEFLKLYGPQFLPLQNESKERMVERANLITLVQQLINQKDNTIQQTIAERMRGSQSMPEIVEQLQTVLDNAKKVKTDINKLEANENLLARRLDTLSDVTTKHVNNFGPIGTEQQAPGFGKNTSNS